MNSSKSTSGMTVVFAAVACLGTALPASAQRLGLYYGGGYRGAFYGGGYYGGAYGAGYFGTYRGGYAGTSLYGGVPYGGGLYGGSFTGAAYLGTSPYVAGYGLYAPYAHAYPYAPYASAYRPYSGLPDYSAGPASKTVTPFRLPELTDAAGKDDKGHVVVRLPRANAEVLINGNKTTQQGKTRRFVSDALAKGRTRTYKFTARWKERGKEVQRTKTVTLGAGERKEIQFSKGSGKKKKRE